MINSEDRLVDKVKRGPASVPVIQFTIEADGAGPVSRNERTLPSIFACIGVPYVCQ